MALDFLLTFKEGLKIPPIEALSTQGVLYRLVATTIPERFLESLLEMQSISSHPPDLLN